MQSIHGLPGMTMHELGFFYKKDACIFNVWKHTRNFPSSNKGRPTLLCEVYHIINIHYYPYNEPCIQELVFLAKCMQPNSW
jgi:hypothetical protein